MASNQPQLYYYNNMAMWNRANLQATSVKGPCLIWRSIQNYMYQRNYVHKIDRKEIAHSIIIQCRSMSHTCTHA